MESYCRKKIEGVEKALNIKLKIVQNQIYQLPDDIDVTYTKSDICESELVNDVVEKVFDDEKQNDSTKNESSNSQFEDEESFHKNYLQKSKFDSKMNNNPTMVMYKTFGLDKFFSNIEFPIQKVILEKLEKMYKLVEIEVSKIENLATTARNLNSKREKSFYTKSRNSHYQKKNFKNERAGLGYKNNKNQNKRFQKSNLRRR
ncbi:hypothetical protein Hanom_Chr10g00946461 [Helianthus anomalus]